VLVMSLADGSERTLKIQDVLEHPERVFGGGSHA
jgi:hypothetical protein